MTIEASWFNRVILNIPTMRLGKDRCKTMAERMYITPKEASEILGFSYYGFLKMLNDPKTGLPFTRICNGKRILINKQDFQNWLDANTGLPAGAEMSAR